MKVSRWSDIKEARAHYLREVDRDAGRARSRHLTVEPGQSMTYEAKANDARRYLAGETGPFPWVEAEAEATGLSETEAAQWVVGRRNALETIGVVIERERRRTKERIKSATTPRAMREAHETFLVAVSGF